jgi:hypothetical protein
LNLYLTQAVAYDDAKAGAAVAVQSFGDFQNFNPHLHVLATDGCFYGNGSFKACPTPQAKDLEEPFRHEVFKMLKAEGKINDVVIENMMNPASGGTDSTCTAATPSGRTMKRVWKIWRATSSEPPFLKSA